MEALLAPSATPTLAIVRRAEQPIPIAQDTGNGAARLLERWLARRSPETRRGYERDVIDFAAWFECASPAIALRRLLADGPGPANQWVMDFVEALKARGLRPGSINRKLSALRSYVKLAKRVGLCSFTIDIEGEKYETYKDTRGPSPDRMRAMFADLEQRAAAGNRQAIRDRAIARLLYNRGLRRGEVCGLDVEHYDRENKRISIHGKCRSEREWLELAHTPSVIDTLEAWLAVRGDATGPLFLRCDRLARIRPAERLNGASVWRVFKKYGTRPHGLRHAAITAVAKRTGGDMVRTAAFSRHKSLDVLKVYIHNDRDTADKAAALLEA